MCAPRAASPRRLSRSHMCHHLTRPPSVSGTAHITNGIRQHLAPTRCHKICPRVPQRNRCLAPENKRRSVANPHPDFRSRRPARTTSRRARDTTRATPCFFRWPVAVLRSPFRDTWQHAPSWKGSRIRLRPIRGSFSAPQSRSVQARTRSLPMGTGRTAPAAVVMDCCSNLTESRRSPSSTKVYVASVCHRKFGGTIAG